MKNQITLTEGNIFWHFLRLTPPMILGAFSIIVFNLVDTFFISKLGGEPLAAISFTFPVIMVIGALSHGIGMGAASVLSRAIGAGDHKRVQRLTTDSLLLSVLIVSLVSSCGLIFLDPLFLLLGASESLLPLIRSYMVIWFSTVAFMIIPMVGNNSIRAAGNTLFPGMIMALSGLINVVLDPVFIFGYLGFPAMGIQGAALATALARAFSLVVALYVMHHRFNLITWKMPVLQEFLLSCRAILHIGIPATLTNLMAPLYIAIAIRLIAGYGQSAVAAVGAATRIEQLVLILPLALGSVLVPFAGQNWGAGKKDRVIKALETAFMIVAAWGAMSWAGLALFRHQLAALFSDDPEIVSTMTFYLAVIPISHASLGICHQLSMFFNAVKKPLSSTALNGIRLFIISLIPAVIGSVTGGMKGLLIGLAAGQFLSGPFGLIWYFRIRKNALTGIN
jgi:putative MATE family efflux protein